MIHSYFILAQGIRNELGNIERVVEYHQLIEFGLMQAGHRFEYLAILVEVLVS